MIRYCATARMAGIILRNIGRDSDAKKKRDSARPRMWNPGVLRLPGRETGPSSAAFELLPAEQDVPRLLVWRSVAGALDLIFHHRQPALDRRPRFYSVVPSLQ